MILHRLIRDDIRGGNFLNKRIKNSPTDYKNAECYYLGDPIQFCIAFYDHLPMAHGYMAELALATGNGYRFNKSIFRQALAKFFENSYYDNNIRLQALISPDNEQALRLAHLGGFTLEGRLREVATDGDRLLFSMLKREFVEKYGRNPIKAKSTTSTT